MKCGSCKEDHDTVEEVRSCFGVPATASSAPATVSPRQRSLAHALARERMPLSWMGDVSDDAYHNSIEAMQLPELRRFIDEMLRQPYSKEDAKPLFDRLENGRYALERDGDIRFYRVGGTGVRRLYQLIGAPGDFREQRIYRPVKILNAILVDRVAALALYGLNVGQCGRCGSPLTQKRTRERGIGDDCYAKMTA